MKILFKQLPTILLTHLTSVKIMPYPNQQIFVSIFRRSSWTKAIEVNITAI